MSFEIVPQDEAWVKQAKHNLTEFYENRPVERFPFEFCAYDITEEYKTRVTTPAPSAPVRTADEARREFFDAEFQLKSQLSSIAKKVRDGFRDDTIQALHPIGSSTGWLTEVFGGETVWFHHRPPYPHPVIHEVAQIDRLRPNFAGSPLYQAAIEHMRYYHRIVGDRIPIGPPDLQSPIDVASMIFDYTQLIYAMIDEPAKVHSLMRMITETMIEACHAFRQEMTDYPMSHFNWWLPRGIFMSDDLQAVLNAELYREFAVPYAEMLAREFGGVALHSCGRILHNIDNVASIKGLIVFNTHDALTLVAPIVKDRVTIILGGIEEVIAPNHPDCKRPLIHTAAEMERYWWADFEKLPTVKGQRVVYQCHALLNKRTAREAYDQMLAISRQMAVARNG